MTLFDDITPALCEHGRPGGEGCPSCMRAARAAKDDGIARADEHANEVWKQTAYDVLLVVADRGRPFTADDVWALLDELSPISTHEPSALGPVFLKASRARRIVKTGRVVPTRFARRHRELTEWVRA